MKNLFILLVGLFLVSCASTSTVTQNNAEKAQNPPQSKHWLIGQHR